MTSVAKKKIRATMRMVMAMAMCGFMFYARLRHIEGANARSVLGCWLLAGLVCARRLGCSVVPQVGAWDACRWPNGPI